MTAGITAVHSSPMKKVESAANDADKTSRCEEVAYSITTSSGMKKLLLSPIGLALDWIDWGAKYLMKKAEPLNELTSQTRTFLKFANLPKQVIKSFALYKKIPSSTESEDFKRSQAITKTAIKGIYAANSVASILEWGSKNSFLSLSAAGKCACRAIRSLSSGAKIVSNSLKIFQESKNLADKEKSTLSTLKITKAAFSVLLGLAHLASIDSRSVALLLLATVKVSFGMGARLYQLQPKPRT